MPAPMHFTMSSVSVLAQVNTPLTVEERVLYGKDINWNSDVAEFDPTDKEEGSFVMYEGGMRVMFDDIEPETMICHKHEGSL